MTSTIVQPLADRLKELLEALALPDPIKVPEGGWIRDHINTPGAEIEVPDIGRADLGDNEDAPFGSYGWDLDFKVTIWFDLREPTAAQQRLIDAVEQWIQAVDADPTLDGLVEEARVTEATRIYGVDLGGRALIGYETTVQTHKLQPAQ